jgi:arsenite methyltransferase
VTAESDRWSRWLLERRDAGDERQRAAALDHLSIVRDRVLAGSEPLEGATLLDVGCGDGLIGLAALDRVGAHGHVIFCDVSAALLEQARLAAEARDAVDRARFVIASAGDLQGIADESVDVVTTRSVLIYVTDKAGAFGAMHRVLRPAGRISLFEPINRLMFPEPDECLFGYDVTPAADLAIRVKASMAGAVDPSATAAMMDFDDRDLANLAHAAGFERVHVECHLDIEPGSVMRPVSVEALLDGAPNPNAPTLREAMANVLTVPEQQRLTAALEHAFGQGKAVRRSAVAYLTAGKRDPASQ